jgi:hypothetical protein
VGVLSRPKSLSVGPQPNPPPEYQGRGKHFLPHAITLVGRSGDARRLPIVRRLGYHLAFA